jgi:hypothetical protein
LSNPQNTGQNPEIKITNRPFESVSKFKYLGTTVANQKLIQEEIKRSLNSDNAYHHSFKNLLSSRLLSRNLKIRIYLYRTIILPEVLYWWWWSLTLRQEHIQMVFENRVSRRICGPRKDKVGDVCKMRIFIICIFCQV